MSALLLALLIVATSGAVVVAMFMMMWAARTSRATSRLAVLCGVVLGMWAVVIAFLGVRNAFVQGDAGRVPPVGIALALELFLLAAALSSSQLLRSLFSDQVFLIRLNVWRLLGAVFLTLMIMGQVPKLWALPAGLGDVLVGASAFRVADQLAAPNGRRLAVAFNVFGLADLIVAIALGVTTNAGPLQAFHTVPTSELLTRFPLVMVPTFLVPLAFAVHAVSLTQLIGHQSPHAGIRDR